MAEAKKPMVSVVIPARNEADHIERCVRSVLESEYPADRLEVIVVDGMSEDGTADIVRRIADRDTCVRLIENPARITPVAMNLGVRHAEGDAIYVMGAHSEVESDCLALLVEALFRTGAWATGGVIKSVTLDDSIQAQMIGALLDHRFGTGGVPHRTAREDGPVDVLGFYLYRSDVFDRIGPYDERLVRNQDNELAARITRAGGMLYQVVAARAKYFNRTRWGGLLRQMYKNGKYGVATWRINPSAFRLRHFLPGLFATAVLVGGVLAATVPYVWVAWSGMLALHLLLGLVSGVQIVWRHRRLLSALPLYPLLFLLVHLIYGVGTLAGGIRFGLWMPKPPGDPA